MEDRIWIYLIGLWKNLVTWRFMFMSTRQKKQGINIEKITKSVNDNWWKELIAD